MKKVILSLVLLFVGWAAWGQYGNGGCMQNNANSNSSNSYTYGHSSAYSLTSNKPEPVEFKLYPNPSAFYFQVDEESINRGEATQFRIFTAMGEEIAHYRLEKGRQYDISELNAGIYYVRFYNYKGKAEADRILSKASSGGGL